MGEYIDDLKQNYEELHESTGESFESIAVRVESHGDKNLAAWLRSRAAGDAAEGADPAAAAPQGRRAANGSLKAAAADDGAATAAAGDDTAAAK
jgi:hypothetical protein